mgnify:CR=1 FL=1
MIHRCSRYQKIQVTWRGCTVYSVSRNQVAWKQAMCQSKVAKLDQSLEVKQIFIDALLSGIVIKTYHRQLTTASLPPESAVLLDNYLV